MHCFISYAQPVVHYGGLMYGSTMTKLNKYVEVSKITWSIHQRMSLSLKLSADSLVSTEFSLCYSHKFWQLWTHQIDNFSRNFQQFCSENRIFAIINTFYLFTGVLRQGEGKPSCLPDYWIRSPAEGVHERDWVAQTATRGHLFGNVPSHGVKDLIKKI